jgi:hypothetical protein
MRAATMKFTSRILEGLVARRGFVERRMGIGCWLRRGRGVGFSNDQTKAHGSDLWAAFRRTALTGESRFNSIMNLTTWLNNE